MLVSWGCLDKVPPTGGLKTTGTYCLPVLEVRSPKSRCLQGCFLLRPGGGTGSMPLSRLLELPASLGCPRACRGIASVSSVFTGSSVSVAKFPFSYKCISLSGIVTLITSAKSLIPNKITFPLILGLGLNVSFWEDKFQALTATSQNPKSLSVNETPRERRADHPLGGPERMKQGDPRILSLHGLHLPLVCRTLARE